MPMLVRLGLYLLTVRLRAYHNAFKAVGASYSHQHRLFGSNFAGDEYLRLTRQNSHRTIMGGERLLFAWGLRFT